MKRLITSLAMLAGFLSCIVLSAAPVPARTTQIRVVYTDWFPYTFQQDGRASGFEIETLTRVLESMGILPVYEAYPWKRCLDELEKGRADALVSMLKTPERQTYTWYPETCISVSRTVFFTRKENRIRFDGTLESLSGYRIGVILGFSYGSDFDNAGFLLKDDAYDAAMLITKLLAGRNDLAAENQAVVSASAARMGVRDQIRFFFPPIHTQKLYVGFSKKQDLESLCITFSEALDRFKRSRDFVRILEGYGIQADDMLP